MPVLAEWFVQLSTKGGAEQQKEIDKSKEALKKAEEQAKAFKNGITVAFASATAAITGFVKAGLSGTEQGAKLDASFALLAETIAAIFLPAVELISTGIQKLAGWLDYLGYDGVTAVLAFGTAFAAAMAIATYGILPLIAAVIGAIALIGHLGTSVEEFNKNKVSNGGLKKMPSGSASFSDPAETFKRLNTAAVGANTAEKQLKVMEQQLQANNRTANAVERLKPATV